MILITDKLAEQIRHMVVHARLHDPDNEFKEDVDEMRKAFFTTQNVVVHVVGCVEPIVTDIVDDLGLEDAVQKVNQDANYEEDAVVVVEIKPGEDVSSDSADPYEHEYIDPESMVEQLSS